MWPRAGSTDVTVELDRRRVLLTMSRVTPPMFCNVFCLCVWKKTCDLPWKCTLLPLVVRSTLRLGLMRLSTLGCSMTVYRSLNALPTMSKRRVAYMTCTLGAWVVWRTVI